MLIGEKEWRDRDRVSALRDIRRDPEWQNEAIEENVGQAWESYNKSKIVSPTTLLTLMTSKDQQFSSCKGMTTVYNR